MGQEAEDIFPWQKQLYHMLQPYPQFPSRNNDDCPTKVVIDDVSHPKGKVLPQLIVVGNGDTIETTTLDHFDDILSQGPIHHIGSQGLPAMGM